jgi:hypothetical protein
MGSSIGNIDQMISFAGDLRSQAKQSTEPELASKLQIAAKQLETTALSKAGIDNLMIGKLLDTFA